MISIMFLLPVGFGIKIWVPWLIKSNLIFRLLIGGGVKRLVQQCSRVIPGSVWGTICNTRMQGNFLDPWTKSLASSY